MISKGYHPGGRISVALTQIITRADLRVHIWNHAAMPKPDIPEPAHDVLAAEEFGMGAADPGLHHGPVTLPSDPTGIEEPHDVLAAEEFAMPAPRPGCHDPTPAELRRSRMKLVAAGALTLVVVRRVLRAKRRT